MKWLQVLFIRLFEYFSSVYHYYGNSQFRKIDLALVFNYLLHNPYRTSRNFALLKGEENIYTYGETPLTTLETIVKCSGINRTDVVYELGCGRGRSCFWLHCFVKCKVRGIEYNPEFAGKAQGLVRKFDLKDIDFFCEDLLASDYRTATKVYLYGTCLDDNFLFALVEKLKALPDGAKVITVSYPLTDYSYSPVFKVIDSFDAPFTWGIATVYIQEKIS